MHPTITDQCLTCGVQKPVQVLETGQTDDGRRFMIVHCRQCQTRYRYYPDRRKPARERLESSPRGE